MSAYKKGDRVLVEAEIDVPEDENGILQVVIYDHNTAATWACVTPAKVRHALLPAPDVRVPVKVRGRTYLVEPPETL